MAPTAGWYDDPRDRGQLRYWDGQAWTEHVTPKQPATPSPTTPVFPGAEQAQQQNWQYGEPTQQAQQAQQTQPTPPPQPTPTYPGYPSYPGYPAWPQQPSAHPPGTVLTPDGAVVTSWVKRLAARLLDGVFVFFGSLPITGYFLYRTVDAVAKEMDAGTNHPFSPSSEVLKWEMLAIAITLVIELGYETLSLRRWGATPGKRILGISVRRWEQGGPLSWSTIGRRVMLIYALGALSLLPLVGLLASIAWLVNYLWPLWDKRNQALHDKLAGTVVIEGARRESP